MIAIKNYFLKLINYLINLVELQLLLTNVVLPFTIYWGMAISPIAIISTLIGSPIIFSIIILTGINYLLVTFDIKITFLIVILEIVCKIWQKFISINLNIPLIIIPNWHNELVLVSTIIYVLIYYKIKHKKPFTIYFSVLYFLLIFCICHLKNNPPTILNLEKISFEYDRDLKKLTFIIEKIPKNYSDWHFRTVLPAIRKNYGRNTVDCIKIKKNNKNLQKYLDEIGAEKFYLELLIE